MLYPYEIMYEKSVWKWKVFIKWLVFYYVVYKLVTLLMSVSVLFKNSLYEYWANGSFLKNIFVYSVR